MVAGGCAEEVGKTAGHVDVVDNSMEAIVKEVDTGSCANNPQQFGGKGLQGK